MFEHRLIAPTLVKVDSFARPFSSFKHIDDNYPGSNSAIRRLFSLARSQDACTLMTEDIDPAGIILDENNEISQDDPNYQMTGLRRISFWKSAFQLGDAHLLSEADCFGYAILKHDLCPIKNHDSWHVFEALFKKYDHKHNCVPSPEDCQVTLGTQRFTLKGLLFAQQNGLNKCCAHVALRSLISRITQGDVSYSQINHLAGTARPGGFDPAKGLNVAQIRAILKGFKIPFRDLDYTQNNSSAERRRYPYQKFIYSGIESGTGALVGFSLHGPAITRDLRHIVPFYGHTFNKDTWAPEADKSYFKVGERLGYIPSEYWTSSFLGHDDNFGPNFCVPRLYIAPKQVKYVVELLKQGTVFSGSQAEVLSLKFLYSVLKKIDPATTNVWLKRLISYAARDVKRIVLRAIAVERNTYLHHLSNDTDWDQNSEASNIITDLTTYLPKHLWIVEVSVPELFPANERKLGDIVLNAGVKVSPDKKDRSNFLFVRLPSIYLFDIASPNQKPQFLRVPSALVSHYPVISLG